MADSHPQDDVSAAADLPWTSIRDLADRGAIALLPVGSTEAHGPHLPLSTDTLIAVEVCRRLRARLDARGQSCLIFPSVTYSLTEFAAEFAGTVSVSEGAARQYLAEILVGIASHGFGRVAVINHHLEPRHFRLVHQAAMDAGARSTAKFVAPDHRRPPVADQLGEEFTQGGSHAGFYETSLVLAVAPNLVREAIRTALPDNPVNLPAKIKSGAKNFLECGGPRAYFGAPAQASAAEGERLLTILVDAAERAVLNS
jgi:creatinine amidohydrolase